MFIKKEQYIQILGQNISLSTNLSKKIKGSSNKTINPQTRLNAAPEMIYDVNVLEWQSQSLDRNLT